MTSLGFWVNILAVMSHIDISAKFCLDKVRNTVI